MPKVTTYPGGISLAADQSKREGLLALALPAVCAAVMKVMSASLPKLPPEVWGESEAKQDWL